MQKEQVTKKKARIKIHNGKTYVKAFSCSLKNWEPLPQRTYKPSEEYRGRSFSDIVEEYTRGNFTSRLQFSEKRRTEIKKANRKEGYFRELSPQIHELYRAGKANRIFYF